jgi:hypothetical protein
MHGLLFSKETEVQEKYTTGKVLNRRVKLLWGIMPYFSNLEQHSSVECHEFDKNLLKNL